MWPELLAQGGRSVSVGAPLTLMWAQTPPPSPGHESSTIREAADPLVVIRKSKNNFLEQQSLRLDRRCHVGGDLSGDLCVATAIRWGEPSV